MLIRIWTTALAAGREAEYLAVAAARSRPMFLAQPGRVGVLFLRGEDRRHAAWSFWRHCSAITAPATSPTYRSTAASRVARGVLGGEQAVTVVEAGAGVPDPVLLAHALHDVGR